MKSEARAAIVALVCGAGAVTAITGFAPDRASAQRHDVTVTVATVTAPTTVPTPPVTTTLPVPTTVPTLPTTTLSTVPATSTLPTITDPTSTTSVTTTTRSRPGGTTTSAPDPTTTALGSGAGVGTGPTTTTAPSGGGDRPALRCRSRAGLPDRRCTPGAAAKRFRLAQACGKAGTRRALPAARVADAVFTAYGISAKARNRYRIDRLVSLELGGANVQANVWPQPRSGRLSARAKDRVEAYLLRLVCSRKLSLRQAQIKLAKNWVAIYRALPRGGS